VIHAVDGHSFVSRLGGAAMPLMSRVDLDPLIDAIGDARYVLLGSGTRGTAQFFTSRAEITKRLIVEKGFSIVAADGNCADLARLNAYVHDRTDSGASAATVLRDFRDWAGGVWVNHQMAIFAEWLHEHNRCDAQDGGVSVFGLDVLGLGATMDIVLNHLAQRQPAARQATRKAAARFAPHSGDMESSPALVPPAHEQEVLELLLAQAPSRINDTSVCEPFDHEHEAALRRHRERFYRALFGDLREAWNIRERQMTETLDDLLARRGPSAKVVVWEHNTHVGDARYANMGVRQFTNAGQLVREQHGEGPDDRDGVFLVGFGTHHGTVLAAPAWGQPMMRIAVPAARRGSVEDFMHSAVRGDAVFVFDGSAAGGVPGFEAPLGHRAIGIVYDPALEQLSHYVPSIIPRRYDAFVFVDETRAADPLVPIPETPRASSRA